jgi:hypothetical protein
VEIVCGDFVCDNSMYQSCAWRGNDDETVCGNKILVVLFVCGNRIQKSCGNSM